MLVDGCRPARPFTRRLWAAIVSAPNVPSALSNICDILEATGACAGGAQGHFNTSPGAEASPKEDAFRGVLRRLARLLENFAVTYSTVMHQATQTGIPEMKPALSRPRMRARDVDRLMALRMGARPHEGVEEGTASEEWQTGWMKKLAAVVQALPVVHAVEVLLPAVLADERAGLLVSLSVYAEVLWCGIRIGRCTWAGLCNFLPSSL
jgi:hypothetical protein